MATYDVHGNLLTEPKKYRILEYNVGNFSHDPTHGSSDGTSGYTGNDIDAYIGDWATFIGSCSADICLITESRKYIDSSDQVLTQTSLYSQLFNYYLDHYQTYTPWGKVLLTDVSQSETQTYRFTNQASSASSYVGALVKLNGVDVYVVDVHFVHGGVANDAVRSAQMAELVANIAQYDNVIIGGDFNTVDLSYELDTLKNAGFTFANSGVFGTHVTYPTEGGLPLDNVGVRGDKLKLRSFEVLSDVTLSDHYPTITEILVG